jgi:hypothetical protein
MPALLRIAAISVALLVLATTTAAADRVLVVVGGKVTAKERDELVALVKSAVEEARWTAATIDDDSKAAEVVQCADGEAAGDCIGALLDAADVDRAVVVTVADEKRDGQEVRLATGRVFRVNGELLSIKQRRCEQPCGADAFGKQVRELLATLVRAARSRLKPAAIFVRSTPTGATVIIDDKPMGATDMEFGLQAGNYLVRVEKDGYHPETRKIALRDGEQMDVEFELRPVGDGPVGPDPKPPVSPRRRRLTPWLVIGGGAALVVTGGVLVAIDQDADGGTGDRWARHRDSAAIGYGIGAAGLVAAGIGVYLLLWGDDDEKPTRLPTVSPVVGGGRDAAWLGVRGSF